MDEIYDIFLGLLNKRQIKFTLTNKVFTHQFGTAHKDLYVIDLVREEENRNSQILVVN